MHFVASRENHEAINSIGDLLDYFYLSASELNAETIYTGLLKINN